MRLLIFILAVFATFTTVRGGEPRIAVMPLVIDRDYREGPVLEGFSNLSDRIKPYLIQRYRCTLLSRHNTLALQSEKFLALPGAADAPADMQPSAADYVVQLRNNTSDRILSAKISDLREPLGSKVIEVKIEDLSDLRASTPSLVADAIADHLNLERRPANPPAEEKNHAPQKKEVLALLTPKFSHSFPAILQDDVEPSAVLGLTLAAKGCEMVERKKLRSILAEHFLSSSPSCMPGAEQSTSLLLGATRFIEIYLSAGIPEGQTSRFRVDLFSVNPIKGYIENVITENWDSSRLSDAAAWQEVMGKLLNGARAARYRPGTLVSDADDALRKAELDFHLQQIEQNGYVQGGVGNRAVLSQCEIASVLAQGDVRALVRIAGSMNRCSYPGRFYWPGCRMTDALEFNSNISPAFKMEVEELDLGVRDVFEPISDLLARSDDSLCLRNASLIRNYLGDFDRALAIAARFPQPDANAKDQRIKQARWKAWALLGLKRYDEARDAITSIGRFDVIELLIAVDACHLLGDKQEEMDLLWRNRRQIGYGKESYQRELLKLRATLVSPDEAIDYYRNTMEGRNLNSIDSRMDYLEILHHSGRSRDALEAASAFMTDTLCTEIPQFSSLIDRIIAENGGSPLPLKSPAEVLHPGPAYLFEIHPIQCGNSLDFIERIARRISEMWGIKVVVYPSVELPRQAPVYEAGMLSFEHRAAVDYVRLLRPHLSEGCVTRIHIFGRDVHAKGSDAGGGTSTWGGSLSFSKELSLGNQLSEERFDSTCGLLSSLSMRVPIWHAYHDFIMKEAGWNGMPQHAPCMFSVHASVSYLYTPKLCPASQRVYSKFDFAKIADAFHQLWSNPERLAALKPVRDAFPDLVTEDPKPILTITSPPAR